MMIHHWFSGSVTTYHLFRPLHISKCVLYHGTFIPPFWESHWDWDHGSWHGGNTTSDGADCPELVQGCNDITETRFSKFRLSQKTSFAIVTHTQITSDYCINIYRCWWYFLNFQITSSGYRHTHTHHLQKNHLVTSDVWPQHMAVSTPKLFAPTVLSTTVCQISTDASSAS